MRRLDTHGKKPRAGRTARGSSALGLGGKN